MLRDPRDDRGPAAGSSEAVSVGRTETTVTRGSDVAARARQWAPPVSAGVIDPGRALVGAVLLLPLTSALPLLDVVRDDDLDDPRLRLVLGVARDLAAGGIRPDAATVHAHARSTGVVTTAGLAGLSVLLTELVSVEGCPVPIAAGHYASAVVEAAVRRRVVEAADRLVQVSESGSVEAVHEVAHAEVVALVDAVARLAGAPLAVAS